MDVRNESLRQLAELALISGRKRQSQQTGFMHHCYSPQPDEPHLTVPIVENLLFALALFKSRTAENVTEAKTLLEALLHFQNKDSGGIAAGNFPIYLHEYPFCKDRFVSINAAAPLFWILKLFHQVLGRELKQRVEDALALVLNHAWNGVKGQGAPYPIAVKAACLAVAGGCLLGMQELVDEGRIHLESLHLNGDRMSWYCPAAAGIILSGLAMVYPRITESPWGDFWKFLESTWHSAARCYIGPAFKERQYGFEPQATLYDLFLGYYTGGFSSRILQDSVSHLEGVLVPACDDIFRQPELPFVLEGRGGEEPWSIYHGQRWACCTIGKSSAIDRLGDKGFHALKLVWGDSARTHKLVCQGCDSNGIRFVPRDDGWDMFFELGGAVEVEDREKNREIMFFVDIHEGMETTIDGGKATTFSLGDEVVLHSGEMTLSLQFHLEKGNGRFMGHRMIGNRPSQLKLKGKDRYLAYDWQVFLRTMERTGPCTVKVSLGVMTT